MGLPGWIRREGIYLSTSTIGDWVGASTATITPLMILIDAHVLASERLHGDDTTVPVLAAGRTDVGRFWTYVRDDVSAVVKLTHMPFET